MKISETKNEHVCMISGVWLHKPTPEDHKRRALLVWRKLFSATEMAGTTSKYCGIAVLIRGEISRLVFEESPSVACSDSRLAELIDKLAAAGDGPSALLAVALTDGARLKSQYIPPLVRNGIAIAHDGEIKTGRKPAAGSETDPLGTGLLLSAASASGMATDPDNALSRWKMVLREAKGCCTSAAITTAGELFVCADSPNDLNLAIAPELSEAVFISTLWKPLCDHATTDVKLHIGGFFTEILRQENVLGVVLSDGQRVHGTPGSNGSSGQLKWSGR